MSDLKIKKTFGLFDNPLNKKLISQLQSSADEVLVFPPIHAEKVDLTETSVNYLKNLSGFDWVIFTDVFAADFFIESLGGLGIDFFELDNLTVCAFGEAVADRLRFAQLHADVIPSKLNDEAIFSAISNYAGAELKNQRILIVREETSEILLSENLKSASALVEDLPIYKAGFADEPANTKLKTLLTGGAVDEFVFSSPEDLVSLKFLSSAADLVSVLNETRVSAVSEIVFQTLQENGFRPLYFHPK